MTEIDTSKVREGLELDQPDDIGHLLDLAHDLCNALDAAEIEARNLRIERDAAHIEVADRTAERDEARAERNELVSIVESNDSAFAAWLAYGSERQRAEKAEATIERVTEALAEYVAPTESLGNEYDFNHGVDRAVALVRAALGGAA